MESEFITYQRFDDPVLANDFAELLKQHDIGYLIQEESSGFDPSLVMSNAAVDYAVKISSSDFERVNELLKQSENVDVDVLDKDYYLFSFTDDELMDVVTRDDEWSAFDVVLARKLFAERGKGISDETIVVIHKNRIEELKAPAPPQTLWIVIGYMASLLGGVLGIFIGWHLKSHKKTLPDGERVYGYSENDREHGNRIFYLSVIVFAIAIIYEVIKEVFLDNY